MREARQGHVAIRAQREEVRRVPRRGVSGRSERCRAEDAVRRDAERLLCDHARGRLSLIDRAVKDEARERPRQIVAMHRRPIVALIKRLSVAHAQVGNIELWVRLGRNAVLGALQFADAFASTRPVTRIVRVVGESGFDADDDCECSLESPHFVFPLFASVIDRSS